MLTDSVFDPVLSGELPVKQSRIKPRTKLPRGPNISSEIKTQLVRESFESELHILPQDFLYINNDTKIPFKCPNGHEHEIAWRLWQAGHGCGKCYNVERVTTESVKKKMKAEGCTLPEDFKFINTRTKIHYKCARGHDHSITWQQWHIGKRCRKCYEENYFLSDEMKQIRKTQARVTKQIQKRLRRSIAKAESGSCTKRADPIGLALYQRYGRAPYEGEDIDHIVPASFFNLNFSEEIELCWDIENLRYFDSKGNESRGNNLTIEEMKFFTPKQALVLSKASLREKIYDTWLEMLGFGYLLS